jgi:hypothetical protein
VVAEIDVLSFQYILPRKRKAAQLMARTVTKKLFITNSSRIGKNRQEIISNYE